MNNNTNTNNQEATKQQENVEVVTKTSTTSTWCKVIGGLTVTAAIGAGAYYAYKKFFKNEEA